MTNVVSCEWKKYEVCVWSLSVVILEDLRQVWRFPLTKKHSVRRVCYTWLPNRVTRAFVSIYTCVLWVETLYVFSFLHERVVCASSLHWNRVQDMCAMERKDGIFLIFVLLHFISKIMKIYRWNTGITVEVFTHLPRAGQTKVSMTMCFNHYDTNVVIQFYGTFYSVFLLYFLSTIKNSHTTDT